MGIKKGLKVVFSPEKADQDKIIVSEKAFPKKSIIGTLSYMPAIFGCTVASVVIRDLMLKDWSRPIWVKFSLKNAQIIFILQPQGNILQCG